MPSIIKSMTLNFRLLVNTNRERSPGGTDTALLSPCLTKKMYVPKSIFQRKVTNSRSPSVRDEAYFDTESEGICWEDSFEIQLEDQGQITDIQFLEEARCSSSLSLSLGCSSSCASPASQLSLPSIDQLLGRIPLASRVTQDVGELIIFGELFPYSIRRPTKQSSYISSKYILKHTNDENDETNFQAPPAKV